MKKFRKTTKAKDVFKEYAKILNGILQLSNRELELFYLLLEINENTKPLVGGQSVKNVLSTDMRKLIMKETRVNKNNLVKYINTLVNKGVLIRDEDGYTINDLFKPFFDGKVLVVNFDLIIEDEENI